MIPCPIGEGEEGVYSCIPAANREVIRSLDYFIVENLRSARRFLSKAEVGRPIDELEFAECNEHTNPNEIDGLIAPILAGRSAGVISEAGLPGIADPGAEIVALCHKKGIEVVPLVGPSSIFLALMASGQNGQSFAFNGYLPIKPPERTDAIRKFERRATNEKQSQIFIETPYRNDKLFDEFLSVCHPSTVLTVAVDLTTPTQYIFSAPIAEWRKMKKPAINKRPAIFIIGGSI